MAELLTPEEERQIADLVNTEVTHAMTLIANGFTFENLSDAAETLCRAANRVAPTGYNVHLDRREWYPGDVSEVG